MDPEVPRCVADGHDHHISMKELSTSGRYELDGIWKGESALNVFEGQQQELGASTDPMRLSRSTSKEQHGLI